MIRRIFQAVLFLALLGCTSAPAPNLDNKDWTITISWNYDFTNYVPCSSVTTSGCITGFTWGFLKGSNLSPIKTPTTAICTGSVQPLLCSDSGNSTLGIGNVTFYVIANGIANDGTAVVSATLTSASTPIPLIAATNMTISVK